MVEGLQMYTTLREKRQSWKLQDIFYTSNFSAINSKEGAMQSLGGNASLFLKNLRLALLGIIIWRSGWKYLFCPWFWELTGCEAIAETWRLKRDVRSWLSFRYSDGQFSRPPPSYTEDVVVICGADFHSVSIHSLSLQTNQLWCFNVLNRCVQDPLQFFF